MPSPKPEDYSRQLDRAGILAARLKRRGAGRGFWSSPPSGAREGQPRPLSTPGNALCLAAAKERVSRVSSTDFDRPLPEIQPSLRRAGVRVRGSRRVPLPPIWPAKARYRSTAVFAECLRPAGDGPLRSPRPWHSGGDFSAPWSYPGLVWSFGADFRAPSEAWSAWSHIYPLRLPYGALTSSALPNPHRAPVCVF